MEQVTATVQMSQFQSDIMDHGYPGPRHEARKAFISWAVIVAFVTATWPRRKKH